MVGMPDFRFGPEVIKIFSCSTQLSMKFFLLVNVKMPTIVGILTFISRKNSVLAFLSLKNAEFLDIFILMQGCKIPLARSHWRVNIGGGRVKFAMRSPDRASAFPGREIVKLTVIWLEKRQNADLTFLKFIPEVGITFLFVNIVRCGTPGDSCDCTE